MYPYYMYYIEHMNDACVCHVHFMYGKSCQVRATYELYHDYYDCVLLPILLPRPTRRKNRKRPQSSKRDKEESQSDSDLI